MSSWQWSFELFDLIELIILKIISVRNVNLETSKLCIWRENFNNNIVPKTHHLDLPSYWRPIKRSKVLFLIRNVLKNSFDVKLTNYLQVCQWIIEAINYENINELETTTGLQKFTLKIHRKTEVTMIMFLISKEQENAIHK